MKVVYDDAIQSEIDIIQNRMNSIVLEIEFENNDATSINRFEMKRRLNPNYNPLEENIEYQLLINRLEKIYLLAVPKYILSLDEYECFQNSFKGGDI